jgi:hypothetical protein
MLGHPAVVDQTVAPGGLLMAGDERNAADLDPLGGGEERHPEGVALDGGHDGPAVEQHAAEAGPLGRDADREAARARADHQEIHLLHFHASTSCHPERSEGGHARYGPLPFVQGDIDTSMI